MFCISINLIFFIIIIIMLFAWAAFADIVLATFAWQPLLLCTRGTAQALEFVVNITIDNLIVLIIGVTDAPDSLAGRSF